MTSGLAKPNGIAYQTLQLDGNRYVILRESEFERLCTHASIRPSRSASPEESLAHGMEFDRSSLAKKLAQRRLRTGLSQAMLARRAGIRPETLNRIERGKTAPDFKTVQKLTGAMNATERLVQRWKATGLSKTDIARRAGLPAKTVQEIERGRANPDFATLRKLVIAIHAAEQEQTN